MSARLFAQRKEGLEILLSQMAGSRALAMGLAVNCVPTGRFVILCRHALFLRNSMSALRSARAGRAH